MIGEEVGGERENMVSLFKSVGEETELRDRMIVWQLLDP